MFVAIKGAENAEEAQKVKENAVITVKYSGTNVYNKLIQPEFMRKRNDVSWSDIVEQQNKL